MSDQAAVNAEELGKALDDDWETMERLYDHWAMVERSSVDVVLAAARITLALYDEATVDWCVEHKSALWEEAICERAASQMMEFQPSDCRWVEMRLVPIAAITEGQT